MAVVVTADGHFAYVTNQGAGTVSVFDLTGAEPAAQKTITVGTHPGKAVASADGRTIYVVNGDSDEVSELDVATAAVERTIALSPYTDDLTHADRINMARFNQADDAHLKVLRPAH